MHATVQSALRSWLDAHPEHPEWHVADLGSYNVNGQVRDIVGGACLVGYDIVQGPGVDYVLDDPPYVPRMHRGQYDLVVCCGTLQVAEYPEWVREEAWALLKPEGWLFLTACAPACKCHHTTPDGEDRHRLSANDLILMLRKRFVLDKCWPTTHPDIVYTGRSREVRK